MVLLGFIITVLGVGLVVLAAAMVLREFLASQRLNRKRSQLVVVAWLAVLALGVAMAVLPVEVMLGVVRIVYTRAYVTREVL